MFFDEVQIRDLNFSNFPSGKDYYSKGHKLFFKKPAPSHVKITVGVSTYPFGDEEFIFKKMGASDELFREPNLKNAFNIYYEKYEYIRTLTLVFPDVKKLCAIMNFHFERLLHYKVIYPTRIKKFKTQQDILEYCNLHNYPIISSFPWEKQKGAESHINNESNMCLYPTTNNTFMIALALRLPIKKNTSLKLYVLPQTDGSYLYAMRDVTSSRKNQFFLIDDLKSLYTYIENVIFENTHYTKKVRDVLGVFTVNEYNEDNLKVYEMSKY
jgi:hypothetical protein